jgi:hypothetical protein
MGLCESRECGSKGGWCGSKGCPVCDQTRGSRREIVFAKEAEGMCRGAEHGCTSLKAGVRGRQGDGGTERERASARQEQASKSLSV